MSVKAWEKEERREREEEASWARSHRPGNKDPPTGTPAPQWVDHTHAQTLTTTCNMYTNTGRIRWDGPVPRKRR